MICQWNFIGAHPCHTACKGNCCCYAGVHSVRVIISLLEYDLLLSISSCPLWEEWQFCFWIFFFGGGGVGGWSLLGIIMHLNHRWFEKRNVQDTRLRLLKFKRMQVHHLANESKTSLKFSANLNFTFHLFRHQLLPQVASNLQRNFYSFRISFVFPSTKCNLGQMPSSC